ncbi:hypothetical protein ACOSQ2_031417 [Xanthoceras sorbifolium]
MNSFCIKFFLVGFHIFDFIVLVEISIHLPHVLPLGRTAIIEFVKHLGGNIQTLRKLFQMFWLCYPDILWDGSLIKTKG